MGYDSLGRFRLGEGLDCLSLDTGLGAETGLETELVVRNDTGAKTESGMVGTDTVAVGTMAVGMEPGATGQLNILI